MADFARIAKHHCNKQLEGKLEYILFFIFFSYMYRCGIDSQFRSRILVGGLFFV